jgi:formylglycine-generating enzyme required for sulfatase activity
LGLLGVVGNLFEGLFSNPDSIEVVISDVSQQGVVTSEPTIELPDNEEILTPVTRNADWTPQIREFDGVEMVLVPSGCFMMGSDDGNGDEQPVHEQCFDEPFWIDRYEVTQGDFTRLGGEQEEDSYFDGASRPVEQITWFEARDFCELRGGYLPTEREWEYAARGPDGLAYPWGDIWDADRAIWKSNSSRQTAVIGSRPASASWVGAEDMSGNVWEWVSSVYRDYPYGSHSEDISGDSTFYVLRGGSWFSTETILLRVLTRGITYSDNAINFLGFRCARS